ncbi:MAG: 30S ribosome-binding factor RbfA [Clostridia bacterium]|nr:30S ribosome-binding factor RbfA [Clostridia bacterium]
MAGHRHERLREDITRELTAILRTVKDPRVNATMLSIVRTEVTNDLSYATVYVSSMDGMPAAQNAVKGLRSAAGYMRRELGAALKLRQVPELRFVADDSIAYSASISQTLRTIHEQDRQREEEST